MQEDLKNVKFRTKKDIIIIVNDRRRFNLTNCHSLNRMIPKYST